LATYADIDALSPKFVILLDVAFVEETKLNYAFNLCRESVYVLYDDEREVINNLRSKYESSKERARVEKPA
jgi:hypothetical protein